MTTVIQPTTNMPLHLSRIDSASSFESGPRSQSKESVEKDTISPAMMMKNDRKSVFFRNLGIAPTQSKAAKFSVAAANQSSNNINNNSTNNNNNNHHNNNNNTSNPVRHQNHQDNSNSHNNQHNHSRRRLTIFGAIPSHELLRSLSPPKESRRKSAEGSIFGFGSAKIAFCDHIAPQNPNQRTNELKALELIKAERQLAAANAAAATAASTRVKENYKQKSKTMISSQRSINMNAGYLLSESNHNSNNHQIQQKRKSFNNLKEEDQAQYQNHTIDNQNSRSIRKTPKKPSIILPLPESIISANLHSHQHQPISLIMENQQDMVSDSLNDAFFTNIDQNRNNNNNCSNSNSNSNLQKVEINPTSTSATAATETTSSAPPIPSNIITHSSPSSITQKRIHNKSQSKTFASFSRNNPPNMNLNSSVSQLQTTTITNTSTSMQQQQQQQQQSNLKPRLLKQSMKQLSQSHQASLQQHAPSSIEDKTFYLKANFLKPKHFLADDSSPHKDTYQLLKPLSLPKSVAQRGSAITLSSSGLNNATNYASQQQQSSSTPSQKGIVSFSSAMMLLDTSSSMKSLTQRTATDSSMVLGSNHNHNALLNSIGRTLTTTASSSKRVEFQSEPRSKKSVAAAAGAAAVKSSQHLFSQIYIANNPLYLKKKQNLLTYTSATPKSAAVMNVGNSKSMSLLKTTITTPKAAATSSQRVASPTFNSVVAFAGQSSISAFDQMTQRSSEYRKSIPALPVISSPNSRQQQQLFSQQQLANTTTASSSNLKKFQVQHSHSQNKIKQRKHVSITHF